MTLKIHIVQCNYSNGKNSQGHYLGSPFNHFESQLCSHYNYPASIYIHTIYTFLIHRGQDQAVFDPTHLGLLPQHVRLPEELKSYGFYSGSVRLVCWYQHSHAEHHRSMCRLSLQDQANQKSEVFTQLLLCIKAYP